MWSGRGDSQGDGIEVSSAQLRVQYSRASLAEALKSTPLGTFSRLPKGMGNTHVFYLWVGTCDQMSAGEWS